MHLTLSAVTDTYTYDATGRKLRRVTTAGSGANTDYINGIEYDGRYDQFYTGGGGPRAVQRRYINYEYSLTDHLGDTGLTFDTGTGVARQEQQDDSMPFGYEISRGTIGSPKNEYLYNKEELREELQQYDYGARFYDPVIGKWNLVDPLSEDDRKYSPHNYVRNNPIRNIDPDGMKYTAAQIAADKQYFAELNEQVMSIYNASNHKIGSNDDKGEQPLEDNSNNDSHVGGKIQDYIVYTGQEALWINGDGQAAIYYPATSGGTDQNDGSDYRASLYQGQRELGPIPQGDYSVNLKPDPNRMAKIDKGAPQFLDTNPRGGIEQIPANTNCLYREASGTMRAHLDPKPGTIVLGRDPSTFYMHNSHKGFTHGCIEVANGLFSRLLDYRKTHGSIDVYVRYPNNTTSTHGKTEY